MTAACSSDPPARTVGGVSRPVFSEDEFGVSTSPRVAAYDIPKGGGTFKLGSPYKVADRWYVPREDPNYDEVGIASWYGADFHGRRTANGEVFDANALTAAHPTLPLPCYAYVTNLDNGKTVLVRVNDRGPYVNDRLIDMSMRPPSSSAIPRKAGPGSASAMRAARRSTATIAASASSWPRSRGSRIRTSPSHRRATSPRLSTETPDCRPRHRTSGRRPHTARSSLESRCRRCRARFASHARFPRRQVPMAWAALACLSPPHLNRAQPSVRAALMFRSVSSASARMPSACAANSALSVPSRWRRYKSTTAAKFIASGSARSRPTAPHARRIRLRLMACLAARSSRISGQISVPVLTVTCPHSIFWVCVVQCASVMRRLDGRTRHGPC